MKKVFNIILPVLLSLLILASMFWYCFIYDRNFTRDMLLGQARYHSTDGNPKMASWFYDMAYELSDQDDSVAIELANQFRNAGNYTKAEYTLSNAIADGGTAKLYMELCKTYVAQDKLLDAVNMLDSIADPAIKAELEAMRPAAPTSDPAPGFYSEYISVNLTADSGKLYFTTGTEYPSTEDAPYTEAFTLPLGETVLRAITVADNGLVSPLTTINFTVGGVIEEVTFTDTAIDAAVREMLGVDTDDTLYTNMLWEISEFTIPEGSMNLQDITNLPYLQKLTIENQTLDTVNFLASLSALKELHLTDCRFPVNEMGIIAGLPALERLTMSDCSLSTISSLENAQRLTYLDLSNNTIRNLEPISSMRNLQTLNLSHNAATSLNALSALHNLKTLDVSYNVLSSISPVVTCRNLTSIIANNNQITSLDGIDNLPDLTILNVNKNGISDARILGNCVNLVELNIGNNAISDITALSTLTKLELFNFSSNQVVELPAWADGSKLRSIDGSNNLVESLDNLKNMHALTHIFMDYNKLTSVDAIAGCYSLVQVNVYGNKIENIDALKEHEIIVNWDPTNGD